jgi:hypothetical protein
MADYPADRQQQHLAWPFGGEPVFLNGFFRKDAKTLPQAPYVESAIFKIIFRP